MAYCLLLARLNQSLIGVTGKRKVLRRRYRKL